MILPDVNVLLYAHRSEFPDHGRYRKWLQDVIDSAEPFGLSELVLSAFIRIGTNPRVFKPPTPMAEAVEFTQELRQAPGTVLVAPGPRHWDIFLDLCCASAATGNLVSDAYFAALALEHNMEWITTDTDYERFPGLRHRHPLS